MYKTFKITVTLKYVLNAHIFSHILTFAWLKQLINYFPNVENLISLLEQMK